MKQRKAKAKTSTETGRRSAPATGVSSTAIVAGCVAIALLVRLVYLGEIRVLPFFEFPIIDGAEYLAWARRILAGEAIWREVPIHGPVYPYFLAAALALSGKSITFAICMQFLLGAASVVFVYRIARRAFGQGPAVLSAAIAAVYPAFLYFEGQLLAPSVVLLLNLALLDRLGALPVKPTPTALIVPGILLGLSIATHPSALVLVPVIAWWLVRRASGASPSAEPRARRGARAIPALVFVAATVCVIGPIALRNASLGGGLTLQRNVGKNLYIGLGPTADGTANIAPGAQWDRLRRQAWDAGARSSAEESRYFVSETVGFALRNPIRVVGTVIKKAMFFVSGIHVDASQDFRYFQTHTRVLSFPLPGAAVLIPLALLGMLRYFRRAPLLVLYVCGYLAASFTFAFATRYAIPAHPVFLVFAAAALTDLARAARARKVESREIALLCAFLLVANLDPFGLRKRQLIHVPGFIAKILVDTGRLDDGLRAYEQAAREYPTDPDIRNGWGTALDRAGRRDEARAQYEAALAAAPELFEARFNLAAHAHEARSFADALAGYGAAIEAAPWRADARLNLGAVYAEMESLDHAAAQFDTALQLAPGFDEALANLAMIESRRKDPAAAAAILKRLAAKEPTPERFVSLGIALTESQDYLGAQDIFRQALALDDAYLPALFHLGMNLAGFQRFEEAIAIWERILAKEPANEVARTAIAEANARIAARAAAASTPAQTPDEKEEGGAPSKDTPPGTP
ncbi:MAG: tetratricopeptide repeat protein [bacterium]